MSSTQERAILAGGCFWGMQDLIRRYPGVISTRVGYSGGDVRNATYRNHGSHAEAIEIILDPQKLSFRQLLEYFFQIHDPTTLNRQGNDGGTSYRSAIFYTSEEQKLVAEETIADVNASGLAGKGCHRSAARRGLLGSRARAPGLSGALSARLYVPLRQTQLEASRPKSRTGTHLIPYSWAPEDQVRGRLYQVSCESCSWNGDACGLSAIRISHATELKTSAAGQGLGL